MNTRTQAILLNAGYRIFRLDKINRKIRYATKPGGWGIFGHYPTLVSCITAFNELMKDENNLED